MQFSSHLVLFIMLVSKFIHYAVPAFFYHGAQAIVCVFHYAQPLHHGMGECLIIGQAGHMLYAFPVQEIHDIATDLLIQIRFVDNAARWDPEILYEPVDPFQVMQPGHGRLGDNNSEIRARKR
jgi:hypothetical protein